jgi:hypothetical protein
MEGRGGGEAQGVADKKNDLQNEKELLDDSRTDDVDRQQGLQLRRSEQGEEGVHDLLNELRAHLKREPRLNMKLWFNTDIMFVKKLNLNIDFTVMGHAFQKNGLRYR